MRDKNQLTQVSYSTQFGQLTSYKQPLRTPHQNLYDLKVLLYLQNFRKKKMETAGFFHQVNQKTGRSSSPAATLLKKRPWHIYFMTCMEKSFSYWPLKTNSYRYNFVRSNDWMCSLRKCILRNFSTFTGEHLCQNLFFNKVAGFRPAILLKKDFGTGVFL